MEFLENNLFINEFIYTKEHILKNIKFLNFLKFFENFKILLLFAYDCKITQL